MIDLFNVDSQIYRMPEMSQFLGAFHNNDHGDIFEYATSVYSPARNTDTIMDPCFLALIASFINSDLNHAVKHALE